MVDHTMDEITMQSKQEIFELFDSKIKLVIKQTVLIALLSSTATFTSLYFWHSVGGMIFAVVFSFLSGLAVADRFTAIVLLDERKKTVSALQTAHFALLEGRAFIEEQDKTILLLNKIVAESFGDRDELEKYTRDMSTISGPKKDPIKN